MNFSLNKWQKITITFGVVFLTLIAVIVFGDFDTQSLSKTPTQDTYEIELNEDGFQPSQLTIQQGAVVEFSTTRDKEFWPASDMHPTHEVYSEFDSKQPVSPDEVWSFQFDRPGTWEFHDHLSPRFGGFIIVSSSTDSLASLPDCDNEEDLTNIQECWRVRVSKVVEDDGVEAGFEFLNRYLEENPDFEPQCHLAAHRVGEALFIDFIEDTDREIPKGMDICTFGAFHGFMETLVSNGHDIQTAHDFCRSIEDEEIIKDVDNIHECYHGIGHGIGEMHYLPNEDDITKGLEPAFNDCEENMTFNLEKRSCALGVFGTIMNAAHQFERENKNPISFCSEEGGDYLDVCLHGAIRHFSNFHSKYFEEFAEFIFEMKNQEDAENLAINFGDPLALNFEQLRKCKEEGDEEFSKCLQDLSAPSLR